MSSVIDGLLMLARLAVVTPAAQLATRASPGPGTGRSGRMDGGSTGQDITVANKFAVACTSIH